MTWALPEKVRIGCWDYRIERWSMPDAEEAGKWGTCSNGQRRIQISDACDRKQAAHTLLHEIFHAILFVYGLHQHDSEERVVGILGEAVASVYRDSPDVMLWIAEGLRCR